MKKPFLITLISSVVHNNLFGGSLCRFIFFASEVPLKERIFKRIKIIHSSENSQQGPHVRVWLGSFKSNFSYLTRQLFLGF